MIFHEDSQGAIGSGWERLSDWEWVGMLGSVNLPRRFAGSDDLPRQFAGSDWEWLGAVGSVDLPRRFTGSGWERLGVAGNAWDCESSTKIHME